MITILCLSIMIVHAPTCNIRSRQNEMEGKMGEGAHRKQEMTPCRPNPRSLFPSRSCSRRFLQLPQCPIRAILVRRRWPLLCVHLLRSSPRQGLAPTKVERNPRYGYVAEMSQMALVTKLPPDAAVAFAISASTGSARFRSPPIADPV